MKNLYKYLPPLLADTFGFQEIIDVTDGMGILDDCADYKGRAGRTDKSEPYLGSRMVTTGIRMEDVIGGTKEKILETFRRRYRDYDPSFVLISDSPVSMMIGTDFEDAAETIVQESGIPAASVELGGHRYYDHGISETLLALARLLIKPAEAKIENGINLLGGNAIDTSSENVRAVYDWAQDCGLEVVSQWGARETAENMKNAAQASVNLVTAASGLALAKWMEKQFQIPYIAAAPSGRGFSERVAEALKTKTQPQPYKGAAEAEALIIGEQLTSNAIRETLIQDYGFKGADVATLFSFDKSLAAPGDKRLKGEEALIELLQSGGYSLIIADPDLRACMRGDCRWIDLTHGAVCYDYHGDDYPRLASDGLNRLLDRVLA